MKTRTASTVKAWPMAEEMASALLRVGVGFTVETLPGEHFVFTVSGKDYHAGRHLNLKAFDDFELDEPELPCDHPLEFRRRGTANDWCGRCGFFPLPKEE